MKSFIRLGLIITIAFGSHCIALAATAAPPVLITGTCPPGSARLIKWIMFEDLNGDGNYDWVVAADATDLYGDDRGARWLIPLILPTMIF